MFLLARRSTRSLTDGDDEASFLVSNPWVGLKFGAAVSRSEHVVVARMSL